MDINGKIIDILKYYPKNNNKLRELISNPNTNKIAKCILKEDIESLSADDFEKIAINGFFLSECGLRTLNYGMKANKPDFLILSKELSNRAKNYYQFGTKDYGIVCFNEGLATKGLSDFQDRKSNLELAIKLFNEASEGGLEERSLILGEALISLAVCHKSLSELGVYPIENLIYALNFLEEAKKIPIIRSNERYYWISGNEANCKRSLADWGNDPINNLQSAINQFKKIRDHYGNDSEIYAKSSLNAGIAIRQLSYYSCPDCKKRLLNETIELYQSYNLKTFQSNSGLVASTLTEQGTSYFELSKICPSPERYLDKAMKFHEKALKTDGLRENSNLHNKILFNEISAKLQLLTIEKDNEYLDGLNEKYRELVGFFENNSDESSLIELNKNFGLLYYSLNRKDEAYSYLKKSINGIEKLRSTFALVNRRYFFETVIDTYKLMVFTCIELNKTEEAFEYAEYSKSRIFLEYLWNKNLNKESSQKIEKNLIKPINLNKLSEIIKERTLIEYFIGINKLAIFIFKKDNLSVTTIKINLNEITTKFIEFLSVIKEINRFIDDYNNGIINIETYTESRKTNCDKIEEFLDEFNELLLKPTKPHLDDKLIIIPHSFLHLLPFQALKDDNKYLIENHEISLAQSSSSLQFLNQEYGSKSLVIGNPQKGTEHSLTHSEKEAHFVARKLNANLLIGSEANKDRILNELNNKNIIHFACHGIFKEYDPEHSGIVLSDGYLNASDYMNLEMNAYLMVLSACETAFSDISNADEVDGLVRSIQYSGCRFVIASLWKVEDPSTKNLFVNFYNAENDPISSLREAELSLIEKNDIYSWAPFQIYGI